MGLGQTVKIEIYHGAGPLPPGPLNVQGRQMQKVSMKYRKITWQQDSKCKSSIPQ